MENDQPYKLLKVVDGDDANDALEGLLLWATNNIACFSAVVFIIMVKWD
jgi:hypothetical protein